MKVFTRWYESVVRSRDLFLSPSQNIPRNGVHLALSCILSAHACLWRMGFIHLCAESLGDDITFWYTERGRVLLGLPEPEITTNPPRRTPALTVHFFYHSVDSRWVWSFSNLLLFPLWKVTVKVNDADDMRISNPLLVERFASSMIR